MARAGGEGDRRIEPPRLDRRLTDDGKTFGAEHAAWPEATGAPLLRPAALRRRGKEHRLLALYRATEMVHRDVYLLRSQDHGDTFTGSRLSSVNVGICVMSSESFLESPAGVLAAWETKGGGGVGERVRSAGAGSSHRRAPEITGNTRCSRRTALIRSCWSGARKRGGTKAGRSRGNCSILREMRLPAGPAGAGAADLDLPAGFPNSDGSFTVLY